MDFTFIELPAFERYRANYLDDKAYRQLQSTLLLNPSTGDVISGTGGLRKLRWEDQRRKKGKRGGLRIIYYWLSDDAQIWLFTLYDKDEVTDLTSDQKRLFKAALERELDSRRNLQRGTTNDQ
jgi:mRNA-degrading endonuclease RelE of RelBE toxin-antitoxin system